MKPITYEQFNSQETGNKWLQDYYNQPNLTWDIVLRNGKSYRDDRSYPELYKAYLKWHNGRCSKLGKALL